MCIAEGSVSTAQTTVLITTTTENAPETTSMPVHTASTEMSEATENTYGTRTPPVQTSTRISG